ncbi:hypothetical protein DAPPUDRAFT_234616 [Daphnia pulex]|uniref:Uncharacterized protein n=1 Tax=Daphnia pulex TaxID=6669 RepID=E9FX14_DAPPU|nr:hypothetical protein DAPPUDRAFT_234616 [Daphnia pulex]|eukprot:EFX87991.1 hypothetical protein DAPPUDRAFT_234616 [Daphnia pulex]
MNISVARSFFMASCGHPGTEILVPMLTFVHDGRGTSINVLLHPYLRDARSSSFTASKHNWFYFTGDLASNAEKTSRRWTLKRRRYLQNVSADHQVVVVNPLAATPLFSPSSLARAALFGLVVYKPRGRRVAKPKICRKASLL